MAYDFTITCSECSSRYGLECIDVSYELRPEYCPFCGSEIPDEVEEEDNEDELDEDLNFFDDDE
jgi:PHP family Zn ribbon phosphoesterase